jgi:hypothetical protein
MKNNFEQMLRKIDLLVEQSIRVRQESHPNPLVLYGRKGFSQTDEDGITIEIVRRLKIDKGSFAEFGVGDGSENNTICLLGMNWRGFWVGGEDLIFDEKKSNRLYYEKEWIDLGNILQLYKNGLKQIEAENVDVVSVDLDGNDLHFANELLKKGCKPKLFIIEYNAKFPPPMQFSVVYNEKHSWDFSDYYGASLFSLNEVFESFGYNLICCNAATGSNAFFVKNEYLDLFPEVPKNLKDIYSGPAIACKFRNFSFPTSPKTLQRLIE